MKTDSILKAIIDFASYKSKGWETQLAFEVAYDSVYDEISEEDFLNEIIIFGENI